MALRPQLQLLSADLLARIVDEARDILGHLGTKVQNPRVLKLLGEYGARVDLDKNHAWFPGPVLDRALGTVPRQFKLFDAMGGETHDFSGSKVHFTPGSAALHILDHQTQLIRKPDTADYVRYVQLMTGLGHIAAQSTAFIPADVADAVSDSYRLFLSLLYGEKPVVTGTFTIDSFRVMRDMQLVVRGGEQELRARPLAIFSCCPTSPLKWSEITSQNVVDCAAAGIPVEFISMPLSGFMAPVTLVGTLVQHTAETLSGIVISQAARPGTPVLYGGSPAVFDMRYETTPMGAVETQMVDCAANEIGKHLGLPTQAYISLSDAKLLDAQAGLETAMGATLAALSGINSISGPGMLDFESCQSLEKLVLDNEICGMTLRLVRGIEVREDFPARPIFAELLKDGHLLISPHTRRHLQDEHYFPGRVIDRANLSRWREDGSLTLGQRAHQEVQRLVGAWRPTRLAGERKKELCAMMEKEARRHGMDRLPARPVEA
jgi:trimethylamine--corrinoid protein Co-methyltransferase